MRSNTHDIRVSFRANQELIALVQKRASARLMSPSELIRDAIRREVMEAA